ncbi:hypothetical protein V5N11_035889 [Cardamine amara subsp. amara]|uniref:Uncharacterized protein n=1 Tax=Cardamine amara subsp. amara TaxID=228776 RepID=A0ABD1AS61_CARAN
MWNSMTDALGKRVIMLAETAQRMWEDLRKIFVPNVDLKIYEVRRKIAMVTLLRSISRNWGELGWSCLSMILCRSVRAVVESVR